MMTGVRKVSTLAVCWLSLAASSFATAQDPGVDPAEAAAEAQDEDAIAHERAAREEERQREREEERQSREEERREREQEKRQQAEERYEEGVEALDESEWDHAVKAFEQVCRLGGSRCDGALYWKAYALNKRGRRADAQAAIAELRKAHPASRWLGEAKALEQELQQQAGRAPSPEQEDDEELKLLALDSLMNSDSERALPLLEEFLKSGNSPRLKDRALFVLSQSEAPRARSILLGLAQGGSNPDLQRKAVKYLGMSGDAGSLKALEQIYAGTQDVAVKRAVLEAYVVADDRKGVFAVARAEKSPELRREAVHALGALEGESELRQLYGAEASPQLREEILDALVAADADKALLELARTEKDARLRAAAVRNLGSLEGEATGSALVSLYGSDRDAGVREAVLEALAAQDNCAALVQLGRSEKEPGLRRAIVEHLSELECPEATDFLLEILKK
jgi:HEAT repeat protein